jgi:hypothetical protein
VLDVQPQWLPLMALTTQTGKAELASHTAHAPPLEPHPLALAPVWQWPWRQQPPLQ